MAVTVKSEREIALMRESCRLLEIVHEEMGKIIKPGITTWEIDEFGEKLIRELGGIPNFKNYNGFPASICVSVNDEVVHGIPSREKVLMDGDIVSLDAGLIYQGYHSDAARTHAVGSVTAEAQKLIDVTKQSFFEGIKMARAGNHLHDISNAIDDYVSQFGYGIVRDLVVPRRRCGSCARSPIFLFPLSKIGMTGILFTVRDPSVKSTVRFFPRGRLQSSTTSMLRCPLSTP